MGDIQGGKKNDQRSSHILNNDLLYRRYRGRNDDQADIDRGGIGGDAPSDALTDRLPDTVSGPRRSGKTLPDAIAVSLADNDALTKLVRRVRFELTHSPLKRRVP